MNSGKNLTKAELIIEVWEQLDCDSVGARELCEIQQSVAERFGSGAVDSPASIARLLADEGAVLRHPEVIDCDAQWRDPRLSDSLLPVGVRFDGLSEAAAAIGAIHELCRELEAEARLLDLVRLRQAVLGIRKDRLLVARSKVARERDRLEADEIAEWLRVWLDSPELFSDWLDLRQRSADYTERFGRNRQP